MLTDLSYRAQLRGWRIEYRPEIVCPAELPVLVTGFKSQQGRWARGSIQTAVKLLPDVLRVPRSLWVKYRATIHLTYYLIRPFRTLSGRRPSLFKRAEPACQLARSGFPPADLVRRRFCSTSPASDLHSRHSRGGK